MRKSDFLPPEDDLTLKVAYDEPCHLIHAQPSINGPSNTAGFTTTKGNGHIRLWTSAAEQCICNIRMMRQCFVECRCCMIIIKCLPD